jgi:hypothetical protein
MRVFTWNEVRRGHVPTGENFVPVIDCVREVVGSSEHVHGALLPGSGLTGSHSSTSDVDVLLMPDSYESLRKLQKPLSAIHKVAAENYVPVNFITVTQYFAESGVHTITPSFYKHLEYCQRNGGVIRGDPIEHIYMNPDKTLADDVVGFIGKKLRYVLECHSKSFPSCEEMGHRLAKILSIAPQICLKMMYLHNPAYDEGSNSLMHDYREVFRGDRLRDSLQLLQEARQKYQALLLGGVTQEEYEREVESMYSLSLGMAHVFLGVNLEKFQ